MCFRGVLFCAPWDVVRETTCTDPARVAAPSIQSKGGTASTKVRFRTQRCTRHPHLFSDSLTTFTRHSQHMTPRTPASIQPHTARKMKDLNVRNTRQHQPTAEQQRRRRQSGVASSVKDNTPRSLSLPPPSPTSRLPPPNPPPGRYDHGHA